MAFLERLQGHLLGMTTRLYLNPWFRAVRYTIFTMMPFLFAISLTGILFWILLDPWGPVMGERGLGLGSLLTGGLYGEAYRRSEFAMGALSLQSAMSMGFSYMPLLMAMAFADRFAPVWQIDRKISVFTTLAAMVMLCTMENRSLLQSLGASMPRDGIALIPVPQQGVANVVLVPLVTTALLAATMRLPRLRIPRWKAFPRKLSHYLTLAFPILLTLLLFDALSIGYSFLCELYLPSMDELLSIILGKSPASVSQEPGFAVLFQFLSWMPWWFGIHGQRTMSAVSDAVYMPAQTANLAGDAENVFCAPFFDAGCVHVMALAIAVIVFSRHSDWRDVSKFSLPMTCINLYDPLLFGMPVVLSPVFLVPFVLVPAANVLIGWVAISWGIVPVFKYAIPLGMPPFLSGMLSTGSIMGAMLQLVWLVMDIFLYAPFVIVSNMADVDALVPKEDEES